jgi:hypothetical protein
VLSDHVLLHLHKTEQVFEMGPLHSINISELVNHVLAADIDDMWKTHDTSVLWIEIDVTRLKDRPQFLNEHAMI